jgi:methylmalonyl-CoA/ethylmalonyl-CoA epimerase
MGDLAAIGQVSIVVKDLDRAVAFYRDHLGLEFLFAAPNLAFFRCGEVRLMLGHAERPEFDHPGSILYYRVADMEASSADLVSRGVSFEAAPHLVARMPDHELWLAFAHDSEGNPFALMCEKR